MTAPQPDHSGSGDAVRAALPEGAILARMKYHFCPADEHCDEDDFDLYDADIDCAECIPVLIVRADAFAALRTSRDALADALQWIASVNAMDYEYQAKARAALKGAA